MSLPLSMAFTMSIMIVGKILSYPFKNISNIVFTRECCLSMQRDCISDSCVLVQILSFRENSIVKIMLGIR